MKIIENELIRPFDVDGTLVMHEECTSNEDRVLVQDPIGLDYIVLRKNNPMIRLLKEEHARGAYIVVWSRGGNRWAANVVRALGLESCVDLVLSKPAVYFDDSEVADWLKDRVWLDPNINYKNNITKE